ncbi:MAG TPA: Gfo/Idh/MocA family oxidoreductase [Pirellulales bacterium]|nr:Gfo/Idh/MocA family oxidoreductase [Pirellulales bacterium]
MPEQPIGSKEISIPTRRDFLKGSTAALVGGALAGTLAIGRSAHAAGGDLLKVGLIGCGGRGTGAAQQALLADAGVKLTAMGDAFTDRLQKSLNDLRQLEAKGEVPTGSIDVSPERSFIGFDAYQKVIDSGVDVVLLCTPPHFRPAHFKAAVAAGKHAFVEKPVAVDAPGVRSVLATAEEAKRKGLSIVSGLCWRYDPPKREIMQRIHDGAVGDVVAIQTSYNTGGLWVKHRQPEWSDMEWQLRNWLYFTWLSGDHNVEQHIHSLDKAAWVMRDEPPVRATGLGGRQVRVQPEYGNIFDHHAVVYEYASGVKVFAYCRQQDHCSVDVSDHVLGTKGQADIMGGKITGENAWRYRGPTPNMYQVEHNELFASIRSGQPIDNSLYMARSTMMAILGRMATYTGQTITWDQAMSSQEDLTPPAYEWSSLPTPPVALPGITKFV